MSREKSVLIPESLFSDLVKHHLLDMEGLDTRIKSGLKAKLDRHEEHRLYSEYKMSSEPEKKEEARKQYLDKKGVPEEFQW